MSEELQKNKEWNREESLLQKEMEEEVMKYLDLSREVSEEEIYEQIDKAFQVVAKDRYLSVASRLTLRKAIYHSMRGLDVLTPLIEDDEITEIMVNRYDRIFIEKNGIVERCNRQFRDPQKYQDVIQQIVSSCNRIVNESSPIVDARLKDGSRVNVVLSPISLDGSTMTIRKFPKQPLTMEKLIKMGALTEEVSEFLKLLVLSGYNIIISGGTGSGKTTFLNALSNYIPKEERIITIEDSAELQLLGVDNLVRLEVRNANVEGNNAVEMNDLIKCSLRMRPNRVIVGECRGKEALDMLQAMNTGHDGSISTLHANSAQDMLTRMETMVLMGVSMPISALRRQIASAIDIVIHLGRLRDHSRKVLEIMEVLDVKEGEVVCQPLFEFKEKSLEKRPETMQEKSGCEDGIEERHHIKVQGQLYRKQKLRQIRKLQESGYYDKYQELMQRIEELQHETI